ncbi:hypothetical protein An04g04600 [Aspergillus niger]|uniref:Uncharacterized protein n=2 Tax=Aspergillus niger TaxID=5061 RepID=A2QIT0_ASPNC|nr:hypothetical protein An04g04600 [Aspergillus niger]CAK38724.1 hypothetical protein An04g04600 [Aspergillus niger]
MPHDARRSSDCNPVPASVVQPSVVPPRCKPYPHAKKSVFRIWEIKAYSFYPGSLLPSYNKAMGILDELSPGYSTLRRTGTGSIR